MHVMIDIETLGTSPNAVILQIGAVAFNTAGMDSEGINYNVSVLDQLAINSSIDSGTIGWWFDTVTPDARRSVLIRENIVSLADALDNVNAYITKCFGSDKPKKSNKVWANSPSFDLVILRNAMQACGIEPAWKYYQEADVRTLRYICDEQLNVNTVDKYVGVAHNAVDDAHNQALSVIFFLESIQERTLNNSTNKSNN